MYDEELLERSAHPRFKGSLPRIAPGVQEHHLLNSSCGDEITIFLQIDPKTDQIVAGRWQGHGCAISLTSADFFIESVLGHTLAEAQKMKSEFINMILGLPYDQASIPAAKPLELVSHMPARVNCAKLPWQSL